MKKLYCLITTVALFATSHITLASTNYTGTISMLEVWRNGNVAFTLTTSVTTCNGQFILNASDPGTKNQYAALLAAQKTGSQIRVLSYSCGSADNYSGDSNNYNIVEYLYPSE